MSDAKKVWLKSDFSMEQWRRNQKITLELVAWIRQLDGKYIASVFGLFTQIRYGWEQKREYIFFYYQPFFSNLLVGLKARGYVQAYCVIPTGLLGYKGPVLNVVVLWLPVKSATSALSQTSLLFYTKQHKIKFITYTQVKYLTGATKHLFFFNTPFGLVAQDVLLQKKIGGVLVCSLK